MALLIPLSLLLTPTLSSYHRPSLRSATSLRRMLPRSRRPSTASTSSSSTARSDASSTVPDSPWPPWTSSTSTVDPPPTSLMSEEVGCSPLLRYRAQGLSLTSSDVILAAQEPLLRLSRRRSSSCCPRRPSRASSSTSSVACTSRLTLLISHSLTLPLSNSMRCDVIAE